MTFLYTLGRATVSLPLVVNDGPRIPRLLSAKHVVP